MDDLIGAPKIGIHGYVCVPQGLLRIHLENSISYQTPFLNALKLKISIHLVAVP